MSSSPNHNNFNQQWITADDYYGSPTYYQRQKIYNQLEEKYSREERLQIFNDVDNPINPSSLRNTLNKSLCMDLLIQLGEQRGNARGNPSNGLFGTLGKDELDLINKIRFSRGQKSWNMDEWVIYLQIKKKNIIPNGEYLNQNQNIPPPVWNQANDGSIPQSFGKRKKNKMITNQ